MVNMGWIPFEMGAAMVLGENIGTTITANIAAAVANANARRAALAHTIFNVVGVCWALAIFTPFVKFIGLIITWLGLPNPAEIAHDATLTMTEAESTATLYGISMLHTMFNLINTLLLVWFTKQIAAITTRLIKDKKGKENDDSVKLKYIDAGPLSTAELTMGAARNEVVHFAEISRNGLDYLRRIISTKNAKEFDEMQQKLVKYEEISDRIEYEIATFLNSIPEDSISDNTRTEAKRMYKIIGELESLGDSGEAISRILTRRNMRDKSFTEEQVSLLNKMLDKLTHAYDIMINNLSKNEPNPIGLRMATDCEIELNDLRNDIREAEMLKIEQNGSSYEASVYFLDTLSEIERMGDFVINVSQALEK
jgi:phosphate:Na+ symporter